MKLSPSGAAFVRHHEGFVGKWYADPVGIGTIGIGFTWASSSFRDWWGKNKPGMKFAPGATITRAEAEDALAYLMDREYGAAVTKFLGASIAQHVYDGTSSVVFNAGAGTLGDRWAGALKDGQIAAAADLLKTTRVTAKGKRLQGLVNRRLDESELIELGDYTIGRPRASAASADAMADGVLVRGERGPAVKQLQLDLQAIGLYRDGTPDELFGPGTEAAVMEFQRSVGLKDDGFAGPRTLEALAQALVAFKPGDTTTATPAPPIATPTPAPPPVVVVVPAPAPAEPAMPDIVKPASPSGKLPPMTRDQYLTLIETAAAGLREHFGD